MKKLLTTFALTCFIGAAFAQQTFKPIHFTSFRDTHWKPLEFNSVVTEPDQWIHGNIDINTKDSVVLITPEGRSPLKYKITGIDPETKGKLAGMEATIKIMCEDSEGKKCDTSIERTTGYMKVNVTYRGTQTTYFCDYVKKIY